MLTPTLTAYLYSDGIAATVGITESIEHSYANYGKVNTLLAQNSGLLPPPEPLLN